MRTVALPLLLLALVAVASAQTTTYTTTTNGCGAKNLGYCTLNAVDQNGRPFQLTLDNRYASYGPVRALTITTAPWPGTQIAYTHGTYTLTPCSSGKTCYGTASFVSDDGTIVGAFETYEYYIGTCSGRGCAGRHRRAHRDRRG